MADLKRAIAFRGVALNTVTVSPAGMVGCTVQSFDYSELDVRQFTEPLALAHGLDVGGVWLGGRRVGMTGVAYDLTRSLTFDRIAIIEAAFNPVAAFEADPSTFGFSDLTWYTLVNGIAVQKTLAVRPNGLRVTYTRDTSGGQDTDPLGIPWSCTFLARDPAIS